MYLMSAQAQELGDTVVFIQLLASTVRWYPETRTTTSYSSHGKNIAPENELVLQARGSLTTWVTQLQWVTQDELVTEEHKS